MKYIFLLCLSLICQLTMAQQRSYGMSVLTASETKAYIIIDKLKDSLALSENQVLRLTDVTSSYWDDVAELKGQRKYEEKLARLVELRDKRTLEILKDESLFAEYQKQFNAILASQRIGYGRRR